MIPFGEIEGVGLSDPSKLQDVYGWSDARDRLSLRRARHRVPARARRGVCMAGVEGPAMTLAPPPAKLVEDGRQHLGRFSGPAGTSNLLDAPYLRLPRPLRRLAAEGVAGGADR